MTPFLRDQTPVEPHGGKESDQSAGEHGSHGSGHPVAGHDGQGREQEKRDRLENIPNHDRRHDRLESHRPGAEHLGQRENRHEAGAEPEQERHLALLRGMIGEHAGDGNGGEEKSEKEDQGDDRYGCDGRPRGAPDSARQTSRACLGDASQEGTVETQRRDHARHHEKLCDLTVDAEASRSQETYGDGHEEEARGPARRRPDELDDAAFCDRSEVRRWGG
jgi:hypothetical protein